MKVSKTRFIAAGLMMGALLPSSVWARPIAYQEVKEPLPKSEHYALAEPVRSKRAVLDKLNIKLDPLDRVYFAPDPALGLGTTITVERAPKLNIRDGKRSKQARSWQPTVSLALIDVGIELGEVDKVDPAREAPIRGDTTITVTRVTETDVVEKLVVPYETKTTEDANLEKGQQKVTVAGKNGERTKVYHVRREDGEEVSRVLTSDKITTAPETRKVIKGTKLPFLGSGTATWYIGRGVGPGTAASKTIPKGTQAKVTNMANGKSVIVKINDYGPVGAEIDLSKDAFEAIGSLGTGRTQVKIEKWIPD